MTTSTITVSRAVPGSPDQVFAAWVEVGPPRRLAFTWVWQDDGQPAAGEDTVVVTFEPEGEATTVTVARTSAEHAPDGAAEQGWSDVMDRLTQSTSSRS